MVSLWECPNSSCGFSTYDPSRWNGYCPNCGKELEKTLVPDGTRDSNGNTGP